MDLPPTASSNTTYESFDQIIDRFEVAVRSGNPDEILNHVPPENHEHRIRIATELIRVDLEFSHGNNSLKSLDWYQVHFSFLFEDAGSRKLIEFELDRLKKSQQAPYMATVQEDWSVYHTHQPELNYNEYSNLNNAKQTRANEASATDKQLRKAAKLYQRLQKNEMDATSIDLAACMGNDLKNNEALNTFCDICATDPKLANRIAKATLAMPEPGDRFLQFKLERLLGSGSFGRVFLARQGDLADRLVALKITMDIGGEAKNLAQLQHTNIIPIYSVHRIQNLRAVCMPYLGSSTLADLVKEIKGKQAIPNTWADFVSSFHLHQKTTKKPAPEPAIEADGQEDPTKTLEGSIVSQLQKSTNPETPKKSLTPVPIDKNQTPATTEISYFQKAFDSSNLKNLDYVTAILWVMKRIVEGLEHAHSRGIVHRDLKPANILFSDDGEPLLLDFNIAADIKETGFLQIGGTLPYMAPEHLESLQEDIPVVSNTCDIYGVGVIFYELLTGFLPYPSHFGNMNNIIPMMIDDRHRAIEIPASQHNPHVTPAINAIIERCLDPVPDRRYHSARELLEDIDRQIHDLPLKYATEPSQLERMKKWSRRNPVLTSNSFILSACLVVLIGVLFAWLNFEKKYRLGKSVVLYRNAREQWPKVITGLLRETDLKQERDESLALCKATLAPYMANASTADWKEQDLIQLLEPKNRNELIRDLAEMLFLWAKTETDDARQSLNKEIRKSKLDQAEQLLKKARIGFAGRQEPAAFNRLERRIAAVRNNQPFDDPPTPQDRQYMASQNGNEGGSAAARDSILDLADSPEGFQGQNLLMTLTTMNEQSSSNPYTWTMLGSTFASNGQIEKAIDYYGQAIALDKNNSWSRLQRGILYLEKKNFQKALRDFDIAISLRADVPQAWLNRALAKLALLDYQGALDDLDHIADLEETPTRIGFIRARCLEQLGRDEQAKIVRNETMNKTPNDEGSWLSRGVERSSTDPSAALKDFDMALKINPESIAALHNKATLQLNQFKEPKQAVETLSLLLKYHPRHAPSLTGRGVILARLGDQKALMDAETALLFDNSADTNYQVACIFALLSQKRPDYATNAVRILGKALRADQKYLKFVKIDPDLKNIRELPSFRTLIDAAQKLENIENSKMQDVNVNPTLETRAFQ